MRWIEQNKCKKKRDKNRHARKKRGRETAREGLAAGGAAEVPKPRREERRYYDHKDKYYRKKKRKSLLSEIFDFD